MLQVKQLALHHGNRKVCEELNLLLEKSECLVIRGINGSGKSSLIHAIMGLHSPSFGQVLMDGHPIDQLGKQEHQLFLERTGLLFQRPHLRPLDTVRKALHHPKADPLQRERLLKFIQLENRAKSLIKDLSASEQRRVDLARTLVHQPKLLIWDEPFEGLDSYWKGQFLQALKELQDLGTTMIIATHSPGDFASLKRLKYCVLRKGV